MRPIYKFHLTIGETTERCYPIYSNELSKDFELQANQQFFRERLNGKLVFQRNDYDRIILAAFDTQFLLEIFISYNAGQTWVSYWMGTFWKTDCEFDEDSKTVTVTPSVKDRYNDVLAGLDKEYNLTELLLDISSIKADKRPMVQIYVPGQSVIACFLSGMWWEQSCDSVEENETIDIGGTTVNKLTGYFLFALNTKQRIINVSGTTSPRDPAVPDVFWGNAPETDTTGFSYTNNGYTFVFRIEPGSGYATFFYEIVLGGTVMWRYSETVGPTSPLPWSAAQYVLTPVEGTVAAGNAIITKMDVSFYARFITDVEEINNVSTFELPLDDMTENRNYHRVAPYNRSGIIHLGDGLSSEPTQWGLYQPGKYYVQPTVYPNPELYPISRQVWGRMSYWFSFYRFDEADEAVGRKAFEIKNAYLLSSVISVLLQQFAPGITYGATQDYSIFFYGTNPIMNDPQTLLITQKSNIINSGYDQPAQNAKIKLRDIMDMLRDCFRCYWFIDAQNRFRIEHIRFFMYGGSYTDLPGISVDLTQIKVPTTGKPWVFGTNKYKFDKPEMTTRYQFGWMDNVTDMFNGYPIDIKSKFVNPENIEEITVSKFTSDVDYMLLNPGSISKDGFALFSAKSENSYNITSFLINKYYPSNNGQLSNANGWVASDLIDVQNISKVNFAQNSLGYYMYLFLAFDANRNYLGYISSGTLTKWEYDLSGIKSTYPAMRYLGIDIWGGAAHAALSQSDISDFVLTLQYINPLFELPYLTIVRSNSYKILQNAYVAFVYLQRYYDYDMPARNYEIDGVSKIAAGTKKLKTQSVIFPLQTDPNIFQLIKTNFGNGTIEKLSVILSSRKATATLKYDTE